MTDDTTADDKEGQPAAAGERYPPGTATPADSVFTIVTDGETRRVADRVGERAILNETDRNYSGAEADTGGDGDGDASEDAATDG